MAPEVPYEEFLTQNGALVNDDGPWSFERSDGDVNCDSSKAPWCDGVANCVSCYIYPSASQPTYQVQLTANVSVLLAAYNNRNNLDYYFSYMVEWASSGTPRGSSLTSKASVGNDSYSIAFASDDYEELLHTRHTWVGSPIERTGSLGLVKAGDKAYIPLTIDLTFPRADKSYINYYMKNATFRITTPSVAVPSTSTRGSTPSASSTEAPLPQTPSAKMPIAAIAGGIAGIVVLGLFAAFFFLYRRRKTAKRESLVELMTPTTKSWHSDSMSSLQANESLITPWSIPARSNPSPAHTLPQTTPPVVKPSITPASTNNASRSHRGPSNGTSMFSRPPAYDAGPSFGTSRGESSWATNTLPVFSRSSSSGPSGASRGESALSQWARAHRAFISGKLEAKLDAAGYMPADDPDSMTETEWMDTWGVTKLELGRLKALFAERQQY